MRRRHLSSIAAVAIVALPLAGCGASAKPLGTVRAAARLTLLQSMEGIVSPHGGTVFPATSGALSAHGAFALPGGIGYEALDLPALERRRSGPTYLDFFPTQLDIAPLDHTALPAGRLWVALHFGRAGSSRTNAAALALDLEALDPQLLLTEIVGGATRAWLLGERVIAHVPYTAYHVSVDLARVLSGTCSTISGAICAAVREELAAARRDRVATVTVEISAWVDGQGRIAQLRASLPGSGWGSVLISLSNFGVAFAPSYPLASQTVDLASLERAGRAFSAATLLMGAR